VHHLFLSESRSTSEEPLPVVDFDTDLKFKGLFVYIWWDTFYFYVSATTLLMKWLRYKLCTKSKCKTPDVH